jgi:hypothetical protein
MNRRAPTCRGLPFPSVSPWPCPPWWVAFKVNHLLQQIVIILQQEIIIMSIMRQLAEYLYIRKPDPSRPKTQWMKYMHGINRISIFMFLLALVILAVKLFLKN